MSQTNMNKLILSSVTDSRRFEPYVCLNSSRVIFFRVFRFLDLKLVKFERYFGEISERLGVDGKKDIVWGEFGSI